MQSRIARAIGLRHQPVALLLSDHPPEEAMDFAIPWRLFPEMEADVPGSFLEHPSWRAQVNTAVFSGKT